MIINMTPHDVNIILDGEVVRCFPPSGKVAKVAEENALDDDIEGVPTVTKVYGEVQVLSREDFLAKVSSPKWEPLSPMEYGVWYIVPMLVGQVLSGIRDDIVGPDYGIGGVRDKSGKISGAVGFIRY